MQNCDMAYERAKKVLALQLAQIGTIEAFYSENAGGVHDNARRMCDLHFELERTSDVRCPDYYTEGECRKANERRSILAETCAKCDQKYSALTYFGKELSPSERKLGEKMMVGACLLAEELSTDLAHETVSEEQILLGKKSPLQTPQIHDVYEALLELDSKEAKERVERLKAQIEMEEKRPTKSVFDIDKNDWVACKVAV